MIAFFLLCGKNPNAMMQSKKRLREPFTDLFWRKA
jgi:hypothetical protein